MDIEIDLEKSLEENASLYFEKSKQAKKKLSGLGNAMIEMQKKISSAEKKPAEKTLARKKKLQWFHYFHWFKTSNGFLAVGGKDAKSNEAIVKKHLDDGDFFLHADIQGGSACVVKAEGKKISETDLLEASSFAACWSKAWQQGLSGVDVYAVSKEQVSKSAPSGESLATGGFMIYGKRQWFRKTPLSFAIGLFQEEESFFAMGGPPNAVKKNCIAFFEIKHGNVQKSSVAKQLLALFEKKTGQRNSVSLDEIITALPGEKLAIEWKP